MNFYTGNYDAAERDFTRAMDVRRNAFDAIWRSLSRERRGADGRLTIETALGNLKSDEWPAPIMLYLIGRLDREALIAAASGAGEKERSGRLCEARFYIAERLILQGKQPDARPLLEQAGSECPRRFTEHEAALAELRKL